MELKVWVEGIQRVVCGVTESTTCQDVVYALAHATGKTGRFTLIERWRNSERLLAPLENPLKVLLKWGEYANDVQFILQRSSLEPKPQPSQDQILPHNVDSSSKPPSSGRQSPTQNHKDLKKSLTFSGGHGELSGKKVQVGNQLAAPNHIPSTTYVPSSSSHGTNVTVSHVASRYTLQSHQRPLAPPPYEVVRGNPPPPPPPCKILHPSDALPTKINYIRPTRPEYQQVKVAKETGFSSVPKESSSNINIRPDVFYPDARRAPIYSSSSGYHHLGVGRGVPSHLLFSNEEPVKQIPVIPSPSKDRSCELPPYREPPPPPTSSPVKVVQSSLSPSKSSVGNSVFVQPDYSISSKKAAVVSSSQQVQLQNNINSSSNVHSSAQNHNSVPLCLTSPSFQQDCPVLQHTSPCQKNSKENADPAVIDKNTGNDNFTNKIEPLHSVNFRTPPQITTVSVLNNVVSDLSKVYPTHSVLGKEYAKNYNSESQIMMTLPDSDGLSSTQNSTRALSIENKRSPEGSKDSGGLVKTESSPNSKTSGKQIEHVVIDGKHKDLVRLVNLQRKKLSSQQVDITKFEAEISYLEGRWKEDESRLAYITSEIKRMEEFSQKMREEVCDEEKVEKELNQAKENEKRARSELDTLQDKINQCESQFAQCQTKIKELEKDCFVEKERTCEEVKAEQDAILREIDKLQTAIAQATSHAEHARNTSQQLTVEMSDLEAVMGHKLKTVEELKQEMREANLDALSLTPSEEIRSVLEGKSGSSKGGSSRRIIGSPRQLENAVPTSKNPHGVWV